MAAGLAAGLLAHLPRTHAGADDALAAAVDAAFLPVIAAHDVPGLAVGVTLRGRHRVFCHGVASRATGEAVTADTLFEVGSLSKTWTATLAAYAQQLGRLSLQDAPGDHVPQLRGSALDRASLLHLATYTAGGLPLQFPDDVATEPEAFEYFRRFRPVAPPGAQRRYSNPSIGLLGHATANAMGGDFRELCEATLYPRLGLRRTLLRVPPGASAHAWGYDRAGQPVRVRPGVFDAPAYGVRSTAADMLRWLQCQLEPAALEPALAAAVRLTHVGRFAVGPMVQGLGWEQAAWPTDLETLQSANASTLALDPHAARALPAGWREGAEVLYAKTGSTNGFGAYATFVPARRLGIVMLANRNIPVPARIAASHAVAQAVAAM